MDSQNKYGAVSIQPGEEPFGELIGIPPELEVSFRRHREHLMELVSNLRSAGIDEGHIEESVSLIIASYKEELVHTLKALKR